ncbi:MAG: hypothetical protein EOP84_12645, partial [Verrucomicrobiaceae bacterium]
NGMLLHESRGGVETFYVPDPLGSVVQTKDASGTVTSEAEYWPYGEVQAGTGTNPSPWGYVGTLGYLKDSSERLYVRARYYRPVTTRWMTVDPLWPRERAYDYVLSQPILLVDSTGLDVKGGCGNDAINLCNRLTKGLNNSGTRGRIKSCIGVTTPPDILDKILDAMAKTCAPDSKPSACVACGNSLPSSCSGICSPQDGLPVGAVTVQPFPGPYPVTDNPICRIKKGKTDERMFTPVPNKHFKQCFSDISDSMGGCSGLIVICNPKSKNADENFYHELSHVIGAGGGQDHNNEGGIGDHVYRIGECLAKFLPKG